MQSGCSARSTSPPRQGLAEAIGPSRAKDLGHKPALRGSTSPLALQAPSSVPLPDAIILMTRSGRPWTAGTDGELDAGRVQVGAGAGPIGLSVRARRRQGLGLGAQRSLSSPRSLIPEADSTE